MIITLAKVFTMASVGFMPIPRDLPIRIQECACMTAYETTKKPDVELKCDVEQVLGGFAAVQYDNKTKKAVQADHLAIGCRGTIDE